VRQVVDFSISLGKVICVADPEEARARDTAMIAAARQRGLTPPMPTPAIGPGALLEGDPLAGHLFVQGEVRAGNKIGRYDDVVGRGFQLVSTAADPAAALDPDLAAYFASIGGNVAHVAPTGPIEDVNGSYRRWFAEHGVAIALMRPDFHIFGAAPAVGGAGKLVAAMRSALDGARFERR
jgi:3-(3-hydroxy-phenyl)propionate hydroxylase